MPKEALMEDLVKRASESRETAAAMEGIGEAEPIWKVTDMDHLKTVSWSAIVTLVALGAVACVLLLVCILCCARRSAAAAKKKKHAFGVKRTGYFKDKTFHARPPKNPTPVCNPDRGAHYLKKSPSPTDVKSPPGGGAGVSDDFSQRKSSLVQAKKQPDEGSDLLDEFHQGHSPTHLRRSSSGLELVDHGSEVASVNADPNSSLGSLHCTVKYCFDKNALVVTVNSCQNLPPKDAAAKSSDPYVKLQLLPEKQHKVKTRVMRRTLNPVYDEDFTFYGVQFNQLAGLTLHFVVLSFDRYSRDDVIGEVMVDLGELDLSSSDHAPVAIAREITPRSFKLKTQGRGEILVSLCYQPAANRITAVVLKARNLPKMDITGLSDPYVKIYLLYNDQRIAKKKTHVKKRTLNPVFNESFVFDLPNLDDEGLKNVSLEFLLLDWDRVTKNEVIGRLNLGGSKCEPSELHHWQEVVSSPRRQIAEWHKLKE